MSILARILVVSGVVAALVCGYVRTAAAQSAKSGCLAAFEEGQRRQLKGELERAAEQFMHCAAASCPARVRAECQGFLETARSPIPGVLFAPVDGANERPLDGVSLSIDGRESRPVDGRMVRIEPGEHQLVFQRPSYAAIRLRLVLREGDAPKLVPLRFSPLPGGGVSKTEPASKVGVTVAPGEDLPRPALSTEGGGIYCDASVDDRPLSTPPARSTLAPVSPKKAPTRKDSSDGSSGLGSRRTAILAAGVVGGLGAVGFAYFGLSARTADVGLDACTPNCEPSKVADIKRDYVLANVSLGLGLAGVATASVLWVISPRTEHPTRARASRPRWALGVGPVTTLTTRF